jgi:hypothetical protein
MAEWFEMSGAPKDGTKIDIWAGRGIAGGLRIPDCWYGGEGKWLCAGPEAEPRIVGDPKRWMHPPQPPNDVT